MDIKQLNQLAKAAKKHDISLQLQTTAYYDGSEIGAKYVSLAVSWTEKSKVLGDTTQRTEFVENVPLLFGHHSIDAREERKVRRITWYGNVTQNSGTLDALAKMKDGNLVLMVSEVTEKGMTMTKMTIRIDDVWHNISAHLNEEGSSFIQYK